ncbi:(S)-mandelate dehydrogenase, mitochondrial [Cytospora mali]|uniref:(S)-mandelate dehydrogenase, mitochondrial n=1 Tax=Cytospora mali TaxID=578113 RepID=A0A194VXA5_CYTMA|nr:(S)-mandelate dehydrogenase, mitochondrial [Valsa mali]
MLVSDTRESLRCHCISRQSSRGSNHSLEARRGCKYEFLSISPRANEGSRIDNHTQDATSEFDKVHSMDIVKDLPEGSYKGDLDPSTAKTLNVAVNPSGVTPAADSKQVKPLSLCIVANDFQAEAQKVLDRRAWVYVSSSANSGLSFQGNIDSWSQVSFRSRILRNVGGVSTRSSVLGHPTVVPFFVSPMGTMGMSHPNAELELVKGLVRKGVHGITSTASTKPLEEIFEAHAKELEAVGGEATSPSRLFFQLYIPTDRAKAVTLVRKVERAGYKGLFITVDTAVLGKRTADRRKQAEEALADGLDHSKVLVPATEDGNENAFAPAVGARPVPGQLSAGVTWDDLRWIREEWPGPIVLKGIQTAEDAKLAAEHGCQGILLSNHGGRQQHTAPNALSTLLEIRAYCPGVLEKLEVYLDGGCRDGADVLKALALGATAVGFGRPFFYAMAAYGHQGVERCIDSKLDSSSHILTARDD